MIQMLYMQSLSRKGYKQLYAVEDAFYGCRQFEVIDPDGHNIIFAKDMSNEPFGLGLGPDLSLIHI